MKERAKSLAQLHAERQCFVQKAIEEGAHETIREKTVNIGVAATFGHSPLEEIGESYHETRANASLHYRGFIIELRDNSSERIRSSHSLGDLQARKSTAQNSRKRQSELHGGISAGINGLIEQGIVTVEELVVRSGFSRNSVVNALGTIEEWGIDVSQFASTIRKNREKIQQLIKEEADKKIQKIMDELSDDAIITNIIEPKKGRKRINPKVFTTVGREALGAYHYNLRETYLFAQALEENGIPNRRVEKVVNGGKPLAYYVFLKKHRARALAAWEKDPGLEKFKTSLVSIVCGSTNADVPKTTQLHSGNYRSVSSVLSDLGIGIPFQHQIEFREWLFEGCPIRILAYQKGRWIAASDAAEFKKYFLEKRSRFIKEAGSKT